jgi:hypothetical protein
MERRPTKAEIAAAAGSTVPDLIAPDLAVLFCGINPGLYSGATGHHFARPGNRFWPALEAASFTDRLVRPWEERQLLSYGLGITNLVALSSSSGGRARDRRVPVGVQTSQGHDRSTGGVAWPSRALGAAQPEWSERESPTARSSPGVRRASRCGLSGTSGRTRPENSLTGEGAARRSGSPTQPLARTG